MVGGAEHSVDISHCLELEVDLTTFGGLDGGLDEQEKQKIHQFWGIKKISRLLRDRPLIIL